jgi:hypothetical protein
MDYLFCANVVAQQKLRNAVADGGDHGEVVLAEQRWCIRVGLGTNIRQRPKP